MFAARLAWRRAVSTNIPHRVASSNLISQYSRQSQLYPPTIRSITSTSQTFARKSKPLTSSSEEPVSSSDIGTEPTSATSQNSSEVTKDASAAEPEIQFDPRTLLDQGIPPTPENYDPSSKPDPTASQRALNPTYGPGGPGGGKGSEYVSSADRKRDRLANVMFFLFLASTVGGAVYLGRNWESASEAAAHADVPNGWGPALFYNRITTRLQDILDYYNLPNAEKLLPDFTPETYRPYTLVLSLEDMLVHPEWTRENGWRMAKRPGVDYFLMYLSQYFEIVIFTSQPETMAASILAKLDPYRTCYQLYRQGTKYKGGKYIKDLTYLNRDLAKIILIDTKEEAWSDQPQNAIKMKPWHGDPKDKELVGLIPFLEFIATMGHTDVRTVLASFPEGSNIALEYSKREIKARQAFREQQEAERAKKTKKTGGGDFLARLLGIQTKEVREEKMFSDTVRERGQQGYEQMAKDLREHGQEYLDMDKKMQEEAMAGMKTSLNKIFTEVCYVCCVQNRTHYSVDSSFHKKWMIIVLITLLL